MTQKETRRIAFCSFKGGAGRTVALANVAVGLAKRGYVVGCIDLDIESCGLNQVFGITEVSPNRVVQTYFLNDYYWRLLELGGTRPLFSETKEFESLIMDVGGNPKFAREGEKIYLIPALPQPKVTAAALRNENIKECTASLFRQFESHKKLDYLLIDCRSGVSTLTLPGLRWSHEVLLFFRPGKQHREGTKAMINWLIHDRKSRLEQLYGDEKDPQLPEVFSLVATAVPEEAKEDILSWMRSMSSNEVRALQIIRDYNKLRTAEEIFEWSTKPACESIGADFDELTSKIISEK